MTAALAARLMLRESRGAGGKLAFFVVCLAVGVAAVVSVAGLASGIDRGLRREARRLLAADLVVKSEKALPEAVDKALDALRTSHPGTRTAIVKEMGTIVAAPLRGPLPGASALVQLKAVGPGWPFYGVVDTEPRQPIEDLLKDGGVLVAPELATKLHLEPGGTLLLDAEVPYADPRHWRYWPTQERASLPELSEPPKRRQQATDGTEYALRSRIVEVDPLDQRVSYEMRVELWRDGVLEAEETHRLDSRCYFKDELVLMVERAGFEEVVVHGDHVEADPTSDDEFVVVVARKGRGA